MSEIEAAQEQLRQIARDMEAIKYRLLGMHASVPPSPGERDPLKEVDPTDPAAKLRGDIECLLDDRIDPAIRDLLDAAGCRGPLRLGPG